LFIQADNEDSYLWQATDTSLLLAWVRNSSLFEWLTTTPDSEGLVPYLGQSVAVGAVARARLINSNSYSRLAASFRLMNPNIGLLEPVFEAPIRTLTATLLILLLADIALLTVSGGLSPFALFSRIVLPTFVALSIRQQLLSMK
jgi:hypothetical protein